MEARYARADELPPLGHRVSLTMADGTCFDGCRVMVEDGSGGCWAWATAEEYEPATPPCWTDGICWGVNEDDVPSAQPAHWHYIDRKVGGVAFAIVTDSKTQVHSLHETD